MNLILQNVRKRFFSLRGLHTAVNDLSVRIKSSEFFVLLGPSGCGKSTTLNLIAGLERPDGGEICFNDTIVSSKQKKIFLSPKERNVAMVFQNYALYPHLSVYENIAFPLHVQKLKQTQIDKAVYDIANKLKLSHLLKSRPAQLSGGERQRVAIARALVRKPSIFLLDEPLSNLDAQLRVSTRAELKQLQRNLGITTVYVTHDQIEAMTLGDRIAILRNGHIEQIGKPDALYDQPINTFVASFIGSPPMNFFEARWSEECSGYMLKIGGVELSIPVNNQDLSSLSKGEKCVAGIRPEDIYIEKDQEGMHFYATIYAIENLGKDIIVHARNENIEFAVLVRRQRMSVGEKIAVRIDPKKIIYFNK